MAGYPRRQQGHPSGAALPHVRAIGTAAILDATGGEVPTETLVVAVVATLVVYWLGEE